MYAVNNWDDIIQSRNVFYHFVERLLAFYLEFNSSMIPNFDGYGAKVSLHYQDQGVTASFTDSKVLVPGSQTSIKVKIEEVGNRKSTVN